MNLGKRMFPIETVTTGRREILLNILGNGQVKNWRIFACTEKKKETNKQEVEERFFSGDSNCIADWGGKSVKEPLVRTVGSVSSRAGHAFSAPDRDFSFHLSFRICCNTSKSHIALLYTPINTRAFTLWRNWLLWKMGVGSRCYRWPIHIEMLHQ